MVAKTLGGFKFEKVEKVSSIKPFSTGTNRNSKQSNFKSILTTVLYAKEESKEAPIIENNTYFEGYDKKAHRFYTYQKHITDIRC